MKYIKTFEDYSTSKDKPKGFSQRKRKTNKSEKEMEADEVQRQQFVAGALGEEISKNLDRGESSTDTQAQH